MLLAKQLVQIDSSDPGAYEEEIGLWITDWFKKQITDFGGKLADQIHVSRLEVLPGRYNVMAKIPGKTEGPGLIYICHMDTVMLGDGWDEDISPLGAMAQKTVLKSILKFAPKSIELQYVAVTARPH